MNKAAFAIVLVALFALAAAFDKDYSHHRLVRVNVASEEALQHLKKSVGADLDVWSHDGRLGVDVDMDILMPATAYETLQGQYDNIRANQMTAFNQITVSQFSLIRDDVQQMIDEHMAANAKASNDDWFTKYRTYDEIKQFTQNMASQYSHITSFFTFGQSWENRDLFGIRISVNGTSSTKPILLL